MEIQNEEKLIKILMLALEMMGALVMTSKLSVRGKLHFDDQLTKLKTVIEKEGE